MNPQAIINLANLKNNLKFLKSLLNPNSSIMPVVKANAYGHGYIEVIKTLKEENIKCVCVATLDEVEEVYKLKLDLDILHLGKLDVKRIDLYKKKNIIATINSLDDFDSIKTISMLRDSKNSLPKRIVNSLEKPNKNQRCPSKTN